MTKNGRWNNAPTGINSIKITQKITKIVTECEKFLFFFIVILMFYTSLGHLMYLPILFFVAIHLRDIVPRYIESMYLVCLGRVVAWNSREWIFFLNKKSIIYQKAKITICHENSNNNTSIWLSNIHLIN